MTWSRSPVCLCGKRLSSRSAVGNTFNPVMKLKAVIFTPCGTYGGICCCVNGVDISTRFLRTQTSTSM